MEHDTTSQFKKKKEGCMKNVSTHLQIDGEAFLVVSSAKEIQLVGGHSEGGLCSSASPVVEFPPS